VRPAVVGVDVVGEGEDGLGVAVVVLQGDLDDGLVPLGLEGDRPRVERALVGVEELDELPDPAGVVELVGAVGALVGEDDAQPLVEEGELPQAVAQRVQAEDAVLEDLRIGQEGDPRPGAAGLADLLHIAGGLPPLVALLVLLSADPDLGLQPLGQGVHHRDAHPVQPARHLVGGAAELAPRMQGRHHDFQARAPGFLVDIDRDPAPVVGHRHAVVDVDGDLDPVARPRQGLVHAVVDDLEDEVVQPLGSGPADVHGGPLADRLETLEDLDLIDPVGLGRFVLNTVRLGHTPSTRRGPARSPAPGRLPRRSAQETLQP